MIFLNANWNLSITDLEEAIYNGQAVVSSL